MKKKHAHKLMIDALSEIIGDQLTINLMLTTKCNMACDHCFYECSPSTPLDWMPNDTIDKIMEDYLEVYEEIGDEAWLSVSVNLIGGEPTLSLDKFEQSFKRVLYWRDRIDGLSIQMTTNGMWLASKKKTRRFYEILALSDAFGLSDNGLTVRISHDAYHDAFLPPNLAGNKALDIALEESFYRDIEVWEWRCPVCDDEGDDGGWCEECDEEFEYTLVTWEEDVDFPDIPGIDERDPWIYVEHNRLGSAGVIPTSRIGIGTNDRSGDNCANSTITFMPDGTANDFCCRGSNIRIGNIHEHSIVPLMAMAKKFIKDVGPSCYTCKTESDWWVKENGKAMSKMQRVYDKRFGRLVKQAIRQEHRRNGW